MPALRRSDLLLAAGFGAAVLALDRLPSLSPVSIATAGGAVTLHSLEGLRLRVDALGGRPLDLHAARALPRQVGLGPLRIAGAWDGLVLEGVTGTLPGGIRLRAGRGLVTARVVELEGAVRVDGGSGGILFASRLELERGVDRLHAPGVAILGPRGTEGGAGGRTVADWSGGVEDLVRAAGR